ncbi:MAG: hypothetical protein ACKESB_01965 [Candidatus Hodgkinia cicadicola]
MECAIQAWKAADQVVVESDAKLRLDAGLKAENFGNASKLELVCDMHGGELELRNWAFK